MKNQGGKAGWRLLRIVESDHGDQHSFSFWKCCFRLKNVLSFLLIIGLKLSAFLTRRGRSTYLLYREVPNSAINHLAWISDAAPTPQKIREIRIFNFDLFFHRIRTTSPNDAGFIIPSLYWRKNTYSYFSFCTRHSFISSAPFLSAISVSPSRPFPSPSPSPSLSASSSLFLSE